MKLFKSIFKIFTVLLFLFQGMVQAQISQGGIPVQIHKLKSIQSDDLILLPPVDNEKMRQANAVEQGQLMLKPFHFAHPFNVSLNPKNSGKWYSDGEVNIWQLRIKSTGAYSLNVIFGSYHLPNNAKLFLIGENSGEIKGAYTSVNNSDYHLLAVEPLAGDDILIQYEEPIGVAFPGEIEITRVSHDFMGIKSYDPRIPLGVSGSCEVNVNCDIANGDQEIRDAVCRVLIEGTELCTGTLVNNTKQDGTPYLLTAYHCINTERAANATVFLFNFESPVCTTVIGDVSRSLSGSSLKASFDSLDFALVRLANPVPAVYRPYFVGWNRKAQAPSSAVAIHHPLGDIKKIAMDNDIPVTGRYSNTYLANGFWKILKWDQGVTESGSSGCALFDQNKQLIGSLTGGSSTCALPTNDYFEKFALSWAYLPETNKQLKSWLDPINLNVESLKGMSQKPVNQVCKPVTNFKDKEQYSAIQILSGTTKKGYFSGTNRAGFTDFAEQYTFSKSCQVQGITLGIAKVKTNSSFSQSMLKVQVYSGIDKPTSLLYTQSFDIKKLLADGMNFLQFTTPVQTTGNFFISYSIKGLQQGDTLAIYMAKRIGDTTNSFYLKNNAGWSAYNSQNSQGNGSALLTELIACSIDLTTPNDSLNNGMEATFYPNPLSGNMYLTVKTKSKIDFPANTFVYDLLGKKINISYTISGPNELKVNFSNLMPGIYFVHVEAGGHSIVGKIAYMP